MDPLRAGARLESHFQRLSVAIQRTVTYNVMEYRATRVPVAVPGLAAARGAVPVQPVQGGQDDERDDDSDADM